MSFVRGGGLGANEEIGLAYLSIFPSPGGEGGFGSLCRGGFDAGQRPLSPARARIQAMFLRA